MSRSTEYRILRLELGGRQANGNLRCVVTEIEHLDQPRLTLSHDRSSNLESTPLTKYVPNGNLGGIKWNIFRCTVKSAPSGL